MEKITERFLRYVKFDTKSSNDSVTTPSTKGQLVFAEALKDELIAIGVQNVELDENGYLMGVIPKNIDKDIKKVGFIAHLDTAPDMSGKNVNPKIVKNYDGKDIILDKEGKYILSPNRYEVLNRYIGQDIITTDGSTLLGADDKAGVASIVTACEDIIKSNVPHGDIKICFTPDEEIGKGANKFNLDKFDADFAYTIDGSEIGELQYENFNAASAIVKIGGVNIHPGFAKDKLVNSMEIAMEFNGMLPKNEKPEYTKEYDGFYMLTDMNGTVEESILKYIIRDHSNEKFNEKKELLENVKDFLQNKYPMAKIQLAIKDSYYNMDRVIEKHFYTIDLAKKAMENLDITPIIEPIRGGTDGARLSHMGLPCPNIFTGGHNFHGRYEFLPIESLIKSSKLIKEIVKIMAEEDWYE